MAIKRHLQHQRTSSVQYVQVLKKDIPVGASVYTGYASAPTMAELESIAEPYKYIQVSGNGWYYLNTQYEHISYTGAVEIEPTWIDGLATAWDVQDYVTKHETVVVGGTNTTVTSSVNAQGVNVYTVSVADAQTTTVSATDSETTVTPTTGTNTTDYQVGLADVTCTKSEDADNYTDETNTHKRISSITVDAKGRVTGYTETTVTEEWDCGNY